jgi:hypothetical protein
VPVFVYSVNGITPCLREKRHYIKIDEFTHDISGAASLQVLGGLVMILTLFIPAIVLTMPHSQSNGYDFWYKDFLPTFRRDFYVIEGKCGCAKLLMRLNLFDLSRRSII